MFITRMHLPRRTVLRGLGATVALPLLDGMVPAPHGPEPDRRRARSSASACSTSPNGMSMPYWYPRHEEGQAGEPAADPAVARAVPRQGGGSAGASDDESANLVKGGGDHARSAGTFLTCVPYKMTNGADVNNAVSVDQIAAREPARTRPSSRRSSSASSRTRWSATATGAAELRLHQHHRVADADHPAAHRERPAGGGSSGLFGTSGSTDPAGAAGPDAARPEHPRPRERRAARARPGRGGRETGPSSTSMPRRFATSSGESRWPEEQNTRELPVVDQPIGVPNDYAAHAKLMMDLLALAYQTDLTRISTFMLAREVSGPRLSGDRRARLAPSAVAPPGRAGEAQPAAPHQRVPLPAVRVPRGQARRHSRGLTGRCSTPRCSSTAPGISDSNTHFHDDLPIALVGGQNAGINGGHYIRYPEDTPLANLHVTILEKLGTPVRRSATAPAGSAG